MQAEPGLLRPEEQGFQTLTLEMGITRQNQEETRELLIAMLEDSRTSRKGVRSTARCPVLRNI